MKSIEQIKFLKRNISGDRMYNQSNLDQKKEGRDFSEIAAQRSKRACNVLPLQVSQEI
jgi:hypothetical protein